MATKGIQALEAQLQGPVPGALQDLDDGHLRHLAEAIRDARRHQAAELKAAGDQALSHIPRLLRVPIRKALG
ncbi:MAG: hypothetical protein ACXVFQ_26000 [Solirubrobacteraceae bacterium]